MKNHVQQINAVPSDLWSEGQFKKLKIMALRLNVEKKKTKLEIITELN